MNNIIKNTPLAISGTLLAILSLGNLLQLTQIKIITLILGLLVITILLLKLIKYPEILKNELENPIVLSTSGTFPMALMVLSTYINNINTLATQIIWITAVIMHMILIIYYTYYYIIKDFNIENYYGSLWVVYIGFTMGAVTGGALNYDFSWIFVIFGFAVMIPTVTLVTYRYIKYPVKIDANKPLICIYTAIFNILTVGYFHTFNNINTTFITIIFIIACALYIFSLYKLIQYVQLPFYPSYSAFTFPFVISAIATTKILTIYHDNIIISILLLTQTIIAVIMVCYVSYQYLINIIFNK